MFKRLIVLHTLLLFNIVCSTEEKQSDFEKMVRQFELPERIKTIIQSNKQSVISKNDLSGIQNATLPFCVDKGVDIDRLVNAERARACIKQNNLDLEIPQKYLYEDDGRWKVLAEGLSLEYLENTTNLTLKEVQDLTEFAKQTCYYDFHCGNIMRNKNTGKIAIVDTENGAFARGRVGDCVQHVNNRNILREYMEPEAQQWYTNYVKIFKYSEEGRENVKPLSHFDNTIDFEHARKAYHSVNKYNEELKNFDEQCLEDSNRHDSAYTATSCVKLFDTLKTLNTRLAQKYNVKRHDLAGKRQKATESIQQRILKADRILAYDTALRCFDLGCVYQNYRKPSIAAYCKKSLRAVLVAQETLEKEHNIHHNDLSTDEERRAVVEYLKTIALRMNIKRHLKVRITN